MASSVLLFSESAGDNVFVNQALEAALFESVSEGESALYLWSNADAVVLGRNQDAFAECRVDALESAGGLLARRLSGGGAVWHDRGNLNFTFVSGEREFDKAKNFDIVLRALASLGVRAELSGRNDICAEGAKVGGNAYYKRDGKQLHHGTLLVTTDAERVARFLTPPQEKFEGKGVRSVSSRVAALADFAEGVTCERVRVALKEAWREAYPSCGLNTVSPVSLGAGAVMKWTGFFSADEWRYGKKDKAGARIAAELFGERAVVRAAAEGGKLTALEISSDSLDADGVRAVRALILGEDTAEFAGAGTDMNVVRGEASRLIARLKEEGIV